MRKLILSVLLFSFSSAFAQSKFQGNSAHVDGLKDKSLICKVSGVQDSAGYLMATESKDVMLYAFNDELTVIKILRKADGKTYSIQAEKATAEITCKVNNFIFDNNICYEVDGESRKETDIKNCNAGFRSYGYNNGYYSPYGAYGGAYYGYGYNNGYGAYGQCYGYYQSLDGKQTGFCQGNNCSGQVLRNLQMGGMIQQCI